jgi:hypothetical protein
VAGQGRESAGHHARDLGGAENGGGGGGGGG